MKVVSSRDFRSRMGKYLREALTSEVVIKSRDFGSFKLVPLTEDDTLMTKEEFFAKIDQAISNLRAGNGYTMMEGESLEEFMERMELEGNV